MLLLINPLMPFRRGARLPIPSRRAFLSNSFATSAGSCRTPSPRGARSGLLRRSCFCSAAACGQAWRRALPNLERAQHGSGRERQRLVLTALRLATTQLHGCRARCSAAPIKLPKNEMGAKLGTLKSSKYHMPRVGELCEPLQQVLQKRPSKRVRGLLVCVVLDRFHSPVAAELRYRLPTLSQ